MNEYRGGEMSMKVVVKGICGWKLWTIDGSENVLRVWLHSRTFDFRMHSPSLRLEWTFFIILVFFSLFFELKIAY